MALQTYTVTVASGNLYGGGTGNVFYLDGARNSTGPGTISWVQGATLRFNQSDGTNDNHPLIFSTNTDTSGIISSGVTYYLDGSSNQSDYTNTSTFNAATTRYVEVTPSSQTDFYYLCYIHGIGMGGIFDITSTTWGALTWGEGLWSQQGNMDVSVSGMSLTSAIGSETVSANADVSVSGISLTSTIGTALGFSLHTEAVTGQSASASVSSVVAGTGDIVGLSAAGQLTSSIGSVTATGVIQVGWGGDTWGENEWGDLSGSNPIAVGSQASFSIGALASVTGNADVSVTGISLTSTIGANISGTSHTQIVTGQQLTMSSESSVVNIGVPVTGISSTMTAGQTTIDPEFLIGVGWGRDTWGNQSWGQADSVAAGGQVLTSAIGSTSVVTDVSVSVSGQSIGMTFGVYSTSADFNLSVTVAEHTLNSSLGSFSLEQTTNESITGQSITSTIGDAAAGLFLDVPVTSPSMSLSLGTQTLEQNTVESPTGNQATMSIGAAVAVPGVEVSVSGLSITASLGEEGTVAGADVTPTGIELTASIGSVNITAWSEIDLGVSNTWAEVDLAA